MHSIKRIAVTGAAGGIAYNLLPRIANGDLFGKKQSIALHLLEVPEVLSQLEGMKMELEDCAFPLLKEIHIGSNPYEIFKDVHYALLVGAKPRGPGMERKDLLQENGKIFVEQGKALHEVADSSVQVYVVGNPCNTNCLIAMHQGNRIPPQQFFAMTRLDQNRASFQLAKKANVQVNEVSNVIIWGNHSATQVPDFYHALIRGKSAQEYIRDINWLEKDFIKTIQERGAAIIKARGKSSAASAAHALIEAVKDMNEPTHPNGWFSAGVISTKNPYQIKDDLIFSFPCKSTGRGTFEIVNKIEWNDFIRKKIEETEKELLEERDMVKDLMKRSV